MAIKLVVRKGTVSGGAGCPSQSKWGTGVFALSGIHLLETREMGTSSCLRLFEVCVVSDLQSDTCYY